MGRAAAVAFALSLVLLLCRVPVDVGPRDTGELTAAAWVLGVSHPTGSPMCLLVQVLGSFVPIGTVVFRQGLMMALTTAGAAGLVASIVARRASPRASWIVGVVVASALVAPTILRSATMTEVYAPTLLLVAASWRALEMEPGRARTFTLGALTGLAAAAHPTARILVPVAIALMFFEERARFRTTLLPWVAGALATAPLVLYVPIAASRLPALSWGDARTPAAFFRHFWASDLRETFAERTTAGHLGADALALVRITLLDLGVPLLSLRVIGFALVLGRRHRGGLLALAACVVLDLAYAVKVNPMGIADRQVGHVALLGLAGLAALVLVEIAMRASSAGALVAIAGVAAALVHARDELRFDDGDLVPRLFTVPGALAHLPPRALVVCDGDDVCGGMMYAQLVEGARPDVGVLPRPFAERPSYLTGRLVHVRAALGSAIFQEDRAVYVQGGDKPYPFPTTATVDAMPLLVAKTKAGGSAVNVLDPLGRFDASLCGVELDRCAPLSRWVLAQAHLGPVGALVTTGDFAQAEALATLGLRLDASFAALWNNRAVARASRGDLRGALVDVDAALARDPGRVPPWVNRASWLLSLGDLDAAAAAVTRLEAACHGCAQARILAVAVDVRAGRKGRAALEAMVDEQKQRPALFCRAFALAGEKAPASCGP